jgi:hypothetical protein
MLDPGTIADGITARTLGPFRTALLTSATRECPGAKIGTKTRFYGSRTQRPGNNDVDMVQR